VNFVLPSETAPGPAPINVINGSRLAYLAVTKVSLVAPAFFSANANGSGAAAAFLVTVGPDGRRRSQPAFSCGIQPGSCTPNEIELPASGNEARLELYGTGLRNVTEIRAISAVIGGVPVPVLYAGAQQQYPGMDQVVVSVPPELKGRGEVDILLLVDGQPANSVRVTFR